MRVGNTFILFLLAFAALAMMAYRQHHAYAEWRNWVTVCEEASQGRSDPWGYYDTCMKGHQ